MSSYPFERRIGIVGHPTTPDVAWSDSQLAAIRDAGFETIQLAIAWAWRPANEVLNLEHLDDPANVAEWRRRIALARKFGFRTLAHFGLPVGPVQDATTCILDPAVRDGYASRLRRLFVDLPEIDEVMIYTYDQLAWLCSEFGDCPRCHGVPLHERLTPFLEAMVDAVQQGKPGARLWWEPWELSAGQTYTIAESIRPDHFGLILHHTIAEVEFVNTTDLWFRNLARLASHRGIPVIGEAFLGGSGEDVDPITHLPCPRLVYQELQALRAAKGVVGVKEYYGLVPAHFSANIALFRAYLKSPDTPLDDLLAPIAAAYGPAAAPILLEAWEEASQAMELFPWDASWLLRRIFDGARSGDGRSVTGASWMTPSWQANRRGFYMVTDEKTQHPWLREDVGLRARMAGAAFARSATLLHRAESESAANSDDVRVQRENMQLAARISSDYGQALLSHLHDRQP
jgi:hypothetical protein